MHPDRREFVQRMAMGAVAFGSVPFSLEAAHRVVGDMNATTPPDWDLSWVKRVTGKHKTVFDVPEVDSGYGVWRASIFPKQYMEVLGAKASDITSVLVLRHNGIALAMQQSFWDKYKLGELKKAMHPITQQGTTRNPVLLTSSRPDDALPADFDALALPKFLERGGIALACNLALQDCIELIKKDGVSDEEARKQAIAALIPGVVLQPSGVFAVIRAQEAGCNYIRAS